MGVLVVGMHRSGTSALAAALEGMGLFVGPPDGLMTPHPQNPAGYFELQAVADLNEEILVHLGGSLYAPPALPERWMADPEIEPYLYRAQALIASTFGERQFALKDPRVALLLPFWRRALFDRCCAVMIVRNPTEVAWSLFLRDGMSTLTSLALWSSYNRSAVQGLAGLPVHVCQYEELVEDPTGVLTSITASLRDWGELSQDVDIDAASARIRPELRRQTWPRSQVDLFDAANEMAPLDKWLIELRGRHDMFEADTVPEPKFWEHFLLEERRHGVVRLNTLRAERTEMANELGVLREEQSEMTAEINALREERATLIAEVETCRRDTGELSLELSALCDEVDLWRELPGEVMSWRQNASDAQLQLEMLQKSRTFRYTTSLRAGYARLRKTFGLS